MSVSLITLGSLSSSELSKTIKLSLPFAQRIVSQWIFVLFSEDEVRSFSTFLYDNNLSLNRFDVSLSYCSSGISASLNEGLRHVTCDWTLIVHSGDFLIDVEESQYAVLTSALSDPSQSSTLQIFGSFYDNCKGSLSMTNHQRKRTYFASMIPWIPHESTFVPSAFYSHRSYNTSYKSAMDFDFFHSLFVKNVAFKTYPFAITVFRLGGTSSNVLLSSMEYKRSIVQHRTFNTPLLTHILSWFYFLFIYVSKMFFLLMSNMEKK